MPTTRTLWTGGLQRVLRPRRELPWAATWIVVLVGVELVGRRADSDVGDAGAVMMVASMALLTWIRHSTHPLPLLQRVTAHLRRRVRGLRRHGVRIGLDLRGSPPLPERLPRALVGPFVGLLALCAVLVLVRAGLPGGVRAVVLRVSAVAWILGLSVLWSALIASIVVTFVLPLVYLDVLARRSGQPERTRQRLVLWSALALVALLVFLARTLPVWAPLAGLLLTLAAFLALTLPVAGKPLQILWRYRRPRSPAFVFRWSTLTFGVQLAAVAACLVLVLLARGDALTSDRPTDTPFTSFLGLALSWTFLGAYLTELGTVIGLVGPGWSKDPARPRPPVVRVGGATSPGLRHRARVALAAAGLRARFGDRARRPCEVPVVLDPFAVPDPLDQRWPRRLAPEQLAEPAVQAALRRRWELLCRRALRKGLRRLMRIAARRRYYKGTGLLIAPHLWVVTHLVRDVDEDELGKVGPSYARTIPIDARRHTHAVFDALEIDLIFVEDGIRFRSLQRVLAVMYEHYDIFGGTRRVDERSFSGLPRVRVLIHEFELDEPFDFGRYPQPEYEHLGRARILHVFRDRGEGEQEAESPRETDWIPAPGELLGV